MRFYPIIHLLPGMSEIIFVVTKQQINVVAAIQGMAATVGNARLCLNTVTHRPVSYTHLTLPTTPYV